MRKKRLIFTLLYNQGYFMLSRNFRLQKVGNFEWLKKHYNFEKIAFSIDELIILDVTREGRNINEFASAVKEVIRNVFIPVAVGGGIRSMSDAEILLNSGADKLVLNTCLYKDKDFISCLIQRYGSQVIVGSIDYLDESGNFHVFIENGTSKIDLTLSEHIEAIEKLSIGEIYLNSIRKDGTGQGYDLTTYKMIFSLITTPVILAGGAGNFNHLIEGLNYKTVDAVATANLFNFLGDSLPKSREEILKKGINLAIFSPLNSMEI